MQYEERKKETNKDPNLCRLIHKQMILTKGHFNLLGIIQKDSRILDLNHSNESLTELFSGSSE